MEGLGERPRQPRQWILRASSRLRGLAVGKNTRGRGLRPARTWTSPRYAAVRMYKCLMGKEITRAATRRQSARVLRS